MGVSSADFAKFCQESSTDRISLAPMRPLFLHALCYPSANGIGIEPQLLWACQDFNSYDTRAAVDDELFLFRDFSALVLKSRPL